MDAPLDQNLDQNQNVPLDSTSSGPAPTPGSLGYQPAQPVGPETPTTETAPPVETLKPETSAEKLQTIEKIGSLTQEMQEAQDQKDSAKAQIDAGDLEEHLVDRTDVPVELHTIQQAKDKLTKAADKEEEEFIQEVQSAHGHGK